MSWPTVLRISSGAAAIWSAVQVAFLAVAFSSVPPSPSAELMSARGDTLYVASFAFHTFAILFFGLAAWLNPWHRIAKLPPWPYGQGGTGALVLFGLPYLAWPWRYPAYFRGSWAGPRYEVFVDLSTESTCEEGHSSPASCGKAADDTVRGYR